MSIKNNKNICLVYIYGNIRRQKLHYYMYVFYSRNYNSISFFQVIHIRITKTYRCVIAYYRTMLCSTSCNVILVFIILFPDIKNIVLFSGILNCNKTKVIIY